MDELIFVHYLHFYNRHGRVNFCTLSTFLQQTRTSTFNKICTVFLPVKSKLLCNLYWNIFFIKQSKILCQDLWYKNAVQLPRRMIYFSMRKFVCNTRYTSWSMLRKMPIAGTKMSVLRQQGHLTVRSRWTVKRPYCVTAELFLYFLGM